MTKQILCVCKGNTCRSPMLAALIQHVAETHRLPVHVESAGIDQAAAGQPANEFSIAEMRERGIDIRAHRSRWIGDLKNLPAFDIIIALDEEVLKAIDDFPVGPGTTPYVADAQRGGVENPWQKGREAYAKAARTLEYFAHDIVVDLEATPCEG